MNSEPHQAGSQRIRLVLEFGRDEDPMLYDDLIRFPKGTRRVNRLRTLAHDGVLTQLGGMPRVPVPNDASSGNTPRASSALINEVFAPAIEG